MARRIHLVGTTLAGTPRAALEFAVTRLGEYLLAVPEETGRPNWVIEFIEARADLPNVVTLRRSRMSQPIPLRPLLHPPRYIARPGHRITPESLKLPYAASAAVAVPLLAEIAAARQLPHLRLQVGVPAPLDVAAFSWLRPLHYYPIEAAAALAEIRAIHDLADGHALYQLEIPLETVAVAKAPRRQQARVAQSMARRLSEFVAQMPQGAEVMVHLCVGNKNDLPLVDLADVGPLIELSNALWAHWPTGQVFSGLHLPFGSRVRPAPYTQFYYAALADLAVPESVHVSAGLVRPEAGLEQHRWALDVAEQVANRGKLGVSTPCGWGRHPGLVRITTDLLVALAVY
jgi:hypothetical protein